MSATITPPVCACDALASTTITNLPNLPQIRFRVGDFNDFRRALLTPLLSPPAPQPEQSLTSWRAAIGADPSVIDLGVMMAEWWAYLSDILTFYNERIANEDYLRTAALPETPAALIQLLGYRPKPAIGATGLLAALVAPSVATGQTVQLPQGLQFQSKPGPGQSPQTFELSAPTSIGRPDQVEAVPPPMLVGNTSSGDSSLLLQGTVTSVANGTLLLLGPRDDTQNPTLIMLSSAPTPKTTPSGQKQTMLTFTPQPGLPALTAENARLTFPNQSASLWTVNGSAFGKSGFVVELASLIRQIHANDWVVFTDGSNPKPIQVQQAKDVLGDASQGGSPISVQPIVSGHPPPIPVLHTELTLKDAVSESLCGTPGAVKVFYSWTEIGTLVDQPPGPWDGVSSSLRAVSPSQFPNGSSLPILLQDSNAVGAGAKGNAAGATLSVIWGPTTATPLSPGLQPPIDVYFNVLPVTRGQTIANEVLGTGDASVPGQSFKLAKSPVTYLTPTTSRITSGPTFASTIQLTVNGLPWKEVPTFYGQPPNAQVFVTREDAQQNTWVDFGDGVNGARLPSGANIVATYRIGAGADAPPAGKLTVIAQTYPGLQAVVNPMPVSGGSDPDPASLLKQTAPRSVLAFDRAVSVLDYQAIAAGVSGVNRATATWSWDGANQRAAIVIYVAGDPGVASAVNDLLALEDDPNRPVTILDAKPQLITLTMTVLIVAGADQSVLTAALTTALNDPQTGLFSPARMGIGQPLFDSQIEAACVAVGVIGLQVLQVAVNGVTDSGSLHTPGEGGYFTLQTPFAPSFQVVAQ